MHRKNRNNPFHLNPLTTKSKRFFRHPGEEGGGGGGGGGGAPADPKATADKAAADAKAAADKAEADAKAAKDAADKASADQKAALDKAAKDAQDAAAKAKSAAEDAKKAADKIAADAKAEADRKAAEQKKADEADPEDEASLNIKTKDLKGIKARAAEKALKDKAKELGFESVEAMEAAAKKLAGTQTDSKLDEVLANQRRLEAELHKTKLNAAVREAALKAGFTDPAYAEYLAEQQVKGKNPDEALSFDFGGYFSGLKGTHAHLFAPGQAPATTGNAGKDPKPQGAADAKKDAADGTKKSAHDLKPEEYQAEVARRFGLGPT